MHCFPPPVPKCLCRSAGSQWFLVGVTVSTFAVGFSSVVIITVIKIDVVIILS